jgi:hypothetical protein
VIEYEEGINFTFKGKGYIILSKRGPAGQPDPPPKPSTSWTPSHLLLGILLFFTFGKWKEQL